MQSRMPCLKSLILGQSDPILNPVQPSLYQLYYDFTRRNASTDSLRAQHCEEAASFQLVVQSASLHQAPSPPPKTTTLHWAYLAEPLSKRNRMGLNGEAVWEFLSLLNTKLSRIQVSCSGLEVLDLNWLKSSPLSNLVELDVSSNDWDVSKWKTSTISVDWWDIYDGEDPRFVDWEKWSEGPDQQEISVPTLKEVRAIRGFDTIVVSELWESLHTLRKVGGVLERFRMVDSSLTSDHFHVDQAVFIDQVLRARDFAGGFNVSGNRGVTDLHWDKMVKPYHPSPPLWLAIHLLSNIVSLDLRSNNYSAYDGSSGVLLQELCRYQKIAFLYLQNAFNGKVSIPPCFWNIGSLRYFSISNDRNAQNVPHKLEGEFPESLVHLPKLLSLHMCASIYCNLFDHPSTFSLMAGTLPELPGKFVSLRLSGMSVMGELPAQWGTLVYCVHLELAMMNITGPISNVQFRGMRSLKRLILRRLKLSGEIPWGQLMHVNVLRISEQPNLQGRLFPEQFPDSCRLVFIEITEVPGLNNGSREIAVPLSIQNCSILKRINVCGPGGLPVIDKTTVPRNICTSMAALEYIKFQCKHPSNPSLQNRFLVCDHQESGQLFECSTQFINSNTDCNAVEWQ
jgi:hypothetical protein